MYWIELSEKVSSSHFSSDLSDAFSFRIKA